MTFSRFIDLTNATLWLVTLLIWLVVWCRGPLKRLAWRLREAVPTPRRSPKWFARQVPPEQIERHLKRYRAVLGDDAQYSRKSRLAARRLLLRHLTPEQFHQFEREGGFVVRGCYTGREYYVRPNSRPVLLQRKDMVRGEGQFARYAYCIVPRVGMPPDDRALAEKAMIEVQENAFLKTANRLDVPPFEKKRSTLIRLTDAHAEVPPPQYF